MDSVATVTVQYTVLLCAKNVIFTNLSRLVYYEGYMRLLGPRYFLCCVLHLYFYYFFFEVLSSCFVLVLMVVSVILNTKHLLCCLVYLLCCIILRVFMLPCSVLVLMVLCSVIDPESLCLLCLYEKIWDLVCQLLPPGNKQMYARVSRAFAHLGKFCNIVFYLIKGFFPPNTGW